MIKRCDKGAGIIVLDYQEYVNACNAHLNSRQTLPNGTTNPYYTRANSNNVEEAKTKSSNLLEEARDNDIITKEESKEMCPQGKNVSKFYCTFKVHKEHDHGKTPPERPIKSGCGAIFENASIFIEHHIKNIANKHPTYLQDTPDFLRCIEEIDNEGNLPDNALLASFDVLGLFTNIPKKEGLEALKEALEEREEKEVPSEFIVRLMDLILENNFFEFNEEIWKQEIGANMGSRPIRPYSNIFMAKKIDIAITNLASNLTKEISPLKLLKQFFDDLLTIWCETSKKNCTHCWKG